MLSCTEVDMESHGTVQCGIFLKRKNVCKVRVSSLDNSISYGHGGQKTLLIKKKSRFEINSFFFFILQEEEILQPLYMAARGQGVAKGGNLTLLAVPLPPSFSKVIDFNQRTKSGISNEAPLLVKR